MPHSTQQRLNRVYLVLRKIASEDIEVVDKSTHPTVLDYAVVYMQKGKSPSVAAKLTAEKLSGGTNYFLGNGVVSIDPKVLEDALWDRMANDVIKAMPKFKEGKEDFALGGTLNLYGQAKGPMRTINPKQEAELRKRVVKKLGRDPFPRTASFMMKGKSPSVAAKLTAERLSGGTTAYFTRLAGLQPELVDTDSLIPTENGPREGHIEAVQEVIDSTNWDTKVVPPILVAYTKDGIEIHDGHHRWLAAKKSGRKRVPVLNMLAMSKVDRASYTRAVNKYRKLINHPLRRKAAFTPTMDWVEERFRTFTTEMWGENTYEKLKDRLTFVRGELKGNHLAAVVYAGNPRVIGDHLVVYANKYTVLVTDRFLALSDQKQAEGVLRHEVIHLGHRGHGREFREMAHRFGAPISEEASAGGGVKIQVKDGARYKTVEEIHDKSFDEVARWLRREHVRPESPYYQKRVRISQ